MTADDDALLILARHPVGSVEKVMVERMDEIDRLIAQPGTLVWVRVANPSGERITELQRDFGIHPLAVEDMRKRNQRPKLDSYEGQHVLVAYEAVPGEMTSLTEMHLFFAERWVLMVQFAGPHGHRRARIHQLVPAQRPVLTAARAMHRLTP